MAESDLDKYLRQLTTNGRINTGLITSRGTPVVQNVAPPAAPRFNYGAAPASGPTRLGDGDDGGGGFLGLLSTAGGVAKSALGLGLKSLGPIDYGRRAWLAGLNELDKRGNADYWDFGDSKIANFAENAVGVAFDVPTKAYDAAPFVADQIRKMRGLSESEPEGRERVQDQGFWDLFNNPEFGYGQILHDKSGGGFERAFTGTPASEMAGKVLDRGIGFAGDVAYDPTTYMSGGATALAGKAARFGAAARMAGLVGKVPGITDEMVARMASRGASAFNNAERALINDPNLYKRGIRLGSPFGGAGSVRVPLTGGIDRFFSTLVSRPRNALTSSKLYQNLVEARRAPDGFEDAYKVLRSGRIDPRTGVTPTMAALAIDFSNGWNAATNSYKSQWSKGAEGVFDGLDESQRIALTHDTQAGRTQLTPLLEQIRDELKAEGLDIGDITKVAGVEGYMPFAATRAMTDLMGPDSPLPELALQFRKNFSVDLTKRQSMTLKRSIRPGTKMKFTVGGETTEVLFEKGTIREANEKLSEAFPEAGISKWFEDDAGILMARYIDEAAKSAAQVRSFVNLLDVAPKNLVDRLENVSTEVIDEVATKLANKEAKEHLRTVVKQRDEQLKETAQKILVDAESMKGDFIEALKESVGKLGKEGQYIANQLSAAQAKGVSLREAKDVVVKKYGEQRKNLEALRTEAEDAFLELSAEADRLRIAAASGVDPAVPWAEVTRRELAKANGDRRKAMQAIEKARDIHQQKLADVDARFSEMEEIVDGINYTLFAIDQIKGAIDDPKVLRELVEEQDLFTAFEPVGQRVVSTPSGAQHALDEAKEKLRQAEDDFDEFLKSQLDDEGIPVIVSIEADAVKQVRLAKMNVGKYKKALRNAWNALDAGARKIEESKIATVKSREFERLDDLVHFVGASKYEVDADGRVRFIWGEDEREFAYHTSRQFSIDAREYEETRASLNEAIEARVAAEQREAAAKAVAEDKYANPPKRIRKEYQSELFADAAKSLGIAIHKSVDDYARARAAHAAAQAVENSIREADPIASMTKKFDELFNAGVDEADKVDFGKFLSSDFGIAIERAGQGGTGLMSGGTFKPAAQALEQFADQLYALARQSADEAVRNSPLSREYKNLLDMQTKYKRSKQHLADATENHRRVKNEHQRLRLGAKEKRRVAGGENIPTPFAGARHNYLWVHEQAVRDAQTRVRREGAKVSRVEEVVYNTHWKPIVEGAEKGQLPYEQEVIERLDAAQAVRTPLSLEGASVKAVEGRLPRRYTVEYVATPKLQVKPKQLTPYEARQAELKRMSPEEREIYAFGETIDDEQIEKAGDVVDNLLGVGDDPPAPKGRFGDQTPEERAANLEKGNRTKKAKAELLLALSRSEITPLEVWKLSTSDDMYKNLRLVDVLANMPDSTLIRAVSVMNDMGITSKRKLKALRTEDPRVGPKQLVDAVDRLKQLKPVAKVDPDKVDGMIDVAQRIVDDAVVPEEISKRLTEIATIMGDQDLNRRGFSAALKNDTKAYNHYNERLKDLTERREALIAAGPRKRQTQDEHMRAVQELSNDIADVATRIAVLDEEALVRSQMVSQKLLPMREFQELQTEFNDLVDWSNRYFAAVEAGATEGDALAARVTAEIYKKRAKATQKRIDSGTSTRFKKAEGSRLKGITEREAAVEEAYDSLIAMLDAAEMVTVERRQLRRHIKGMEKRSVNPIEGLDDVADERGLRNALVEAGLREEEEFLDDDYIDSLGRTVESLDRGDTDGLTITYGAGPSKEMEQRLEQLGADMRDRNRDLSRAVGQLLGIGGGAGRDLSVMGDTRKLFVKRLRNEFRKAGPDGVRKVLVETIPDVEKNNPRKFMELLRSHSNRSRPERGVLAQQQRVIDALTVETNDLPRAIRTAQTDLQGLQDDVVKLESDIETAIKKKRPAEVVKLMQGRLEMKKEAVNRSQAYLDGLMVPKSKKQRKIDALARREITMDWRDVLDVAPEGYVTPLVQDNRMWHKVMAAYRAKRGMYELELVKHESDLFRGRQLQAAKQAEIKAAQDEVVRAQFGVEAAQRAARQIPSGPEIVDAVRQQKNDLLTKAGLIDETTERLSFQYDALGEQIRDEAGMEWVEVSELERQITSNDFYQLLNEGKAKAVAKKVSDVEDSIKKLDAKKFGSKNIEEIRKEFESLVDVIDEDDMYGFVATEMYHKHVQDLANYTELKTQIGDLRAMRDQAKKDELIRIFKHKANKGFVEMGEMLGKDNMIAVKEPMANMINNIEKSIQSGAFIETVELANRFFKTYATLTPGFHVRNWMGATFMNLSEGVELGNTREAYQIAKKYRDDANGYMSALRVAARQGDAKAQRELFALDAAFGSGASGRLDFGEIGKANAESAFVRKAMETKTADKLLANKLVKASQRVGAEFVEMPIRMALALDSLDRNMTSGQAIARIKRVHFDYSELSKFDKKMKALIPFWVFMSRNMPLQMQQILTKPKMYTAYNSVIRNFKADNQDMLQWQEERNGWVLFNQSDLFAPNSNVAILPDLQHVSMIDDLEKMDPRNPLRFLSQMNPMVRVPAEFALDKQFYKNRPFYPGENKLEYAAFQTIPQLGQGARLTATGPYEERSRLQSMLNFLGVPLYDVPQDRLRREQRRND